MSVDYNTFAGTRAAALMTKIDKKLHRKRLTTQGSEITYTYDIQTQFMDDGSLAIELCDEDSGDIHKFTLKIERGAL